jgi:hypothetical protein
VAKSAAVRILLTLFFGLFSLPFLGFASWLIYRWISFHLGKQPFLDYPYSYIGSAGLVLGVLSLLCVLYGAWRRSYWGVLFALPVIAGLWAMVAIPNIVPYDFATVSHLGHITSNIDLYRRQHGRFPRDEHELREAATSVLEEPSDFVKQGKRLNYQIVVISGASGPWTSHPGGVPGVVFYAVTEDGQTVWPTVSDLDRQNHVRFRKIGINDGDATVLKLGSR